MKKLSVLSGMTAVSLALGTLAMPFAAVSAESLANYDFESGAGGWGAWGDTSVSVTNNAAHTGTKSLYVGDRGEAWNGAACDMSGILAAGQSYEFSAWVYQTESTVIEPIKLQMKYLDADGEAVYDTIGMAETGGDWAKISAPSYTVPTGATGMTLYFETPESLMGFYLDDIVILGSKIAPVDVKGEYETGVGTGLKDRFADYFKIGTCLNSNEVGKPQAQALVAEHFNSVTPENELKPDSMLQQMASQQMGDNVNPQVALSSGARSILSYCDKNNIPMRGHCLVWHSQTPDWFFKENFSNDGAYVSKSIMKQRMENYIKNVMSLLAKEYPNVEFYAWDVVNEAFTDQGELRTAGSNNVNQGCSLWTQIYGDDSFITDAFTFAKKYAPTGCKLFYNDYNEYIDSKMNAIIAEVSKLYKAGLLDGMGFQSHLDTSYPSVAQYCNALGKYAAIGCEIQITELDITCKDAATQATVYKGVFDACKEYSDQISAVVFWGTQDAVSWRSSQNPLIFNSSYLPKEAYFAIANATPIQKGTTEPPVTTTEAPVTTTVPPVTTTPAPVTTPPMSLVTTTEITRGTSPGISTIVSLIQAPTKLVYEVGEELDLSGGVVSVKSLYHLDPTQSWSDVSMTDDRITVDDSEFNSEIPGIYTIRIGVFGYGDCSPASFEVTVCEKSYVSFSISSKPTKTVYLIGEELDLTGGMASASGCSQGAVYWDTFLQPFTYSMFRVDASAFNNQVPGTYRIYVSVNSDGITAGDFFDVVVVSEYSPNTDNCMLDVFLPPEKTIYGFNEYLNLNGMAIACISYDEAGHGTSTTLTKDQYEIDASNFDNTLPGTYNIRCTYTCEHGKKMTINVPVIVDFAVTGKFTRVIAPENLRVRTGETPDLSAVRVFADITYPDGITTERDVTEHCRYSLLDDNKVTVNFDLSLLTEVSWTGENLTIPVVCLNPAVRVYGDVNDDGNVDLSDVILLARYLAEDEEIAKPSRWGLLNAEVVGDSVLSVNDLQTIVQYLAKLLPELNPTIPT